MRGVGRCECEISSDVARGGVKDHLLGYVSPSNHPYRPHVAYGGDRVTSCDMFIHKTGKGVASVGNVWDISWEPSQTFHVTLGPD